MQGQFVNTTVADEFYNGTQLPPNKLGFTMGANYIVGPVQMRQVRSKVNSLSKAFLVMYTFFRWIHAWSQLKISEPSRIAIRHL